METDELVAHAIPVTVQDGVVGIVQQIGLLKHQVRVTRRLSGDMTRETLLLRPGQAMYYVAYRNHFYEADCWRVRWFTDEKRARIEYDAHRQILTSRLSCQCQIGMVHFDGIILSKSNG